MLLFFIPYENKLALELMYFLGVLESVLRLAVLRSWHGNYQGKERTGSFTGRGLTPRHAEFVTSTKIRGEWRKKKNERKKN